MNPANLELTKKATDLLMMYEETQSIPNPEIVEFEEGSFNIEFKEDGKLLDEDCYLVDSEGKIYIVSTPIAMYHVCNVDSTLEEIQVSFDKLSELIYEKTLNCTK